MKKFLQKISVIAFFMAGAFTVPSLSYADLVNEMVEVKCIPELNYLAIEKKEVNGEVTMNALKMKGPELFKKYGLLDVSSLFEFGPDYKWQRAKTFETACKLQTTTRDNKKIRPLNFEIILEGNYENPNPEGYCGGWRSFYVTIKRKEKTYVERVPFEEGCNSSRGVSIIDINPQEEYMSVNTWHKMDETLFWLDDKFQTITQKRVYPEKANSR